MFLVMLVKLKGLMQLQKKNNLKVIYDAAHSFNVKYKGKSILTYGDISAISFHATKVFHSIEGGALIINNDELVEKARYLINFGIKNTEEIPELGTNAKMNEFEAAMGLCVLNDIQELNKKRKKIYYLYLQELEKYVTLQKMNTHSVQNHSYLPIILKNTKQLKMVEDGLKKENIYPRRYFYPSLDTLKYIKPKQYCKISRDISSRILCLPMYPELETNNVKKICKIIIENLC